MLKRVSDLDPEADHPAAILFFLSRIEQLLHNVNTMDMSKVPCEAVATSSFEWPAAAAI